MPPRPATAKAGWKLGLGSVAAMQAAGTERPLVGRILAGHRYDNGATVSVLCQAPITVEFEVAFVLGGGISRRARRRPIRCRR